MAQLDSQLAVDVHRQTGTVEAGRRLAAPHIGDPEVAISERNRLAAERVGRRQEVGLEERRHPGHRCLGGRKLRKPQQRRRTTVRGVRVRRAGEADQQLRSRGEAERRVGDECAQGDEAGAGPPGRDRLLERHDVATAVEGNDAVWSDDVTRTVHDETVDPGALKTPRRHDEPANGDAAVEHRHVAQDDARRRRPRRADPENRSVGRVRVGARPRLSDQGPVRGAHFRQSQRPAGPCRRSEDEQDGR